MIAQVIILQSLSSYNIVPNKTAELLQKQLILLWLSSKLWISEENLQVKIDSVLSISCSLYYEFGCSKNHNGFENLNTWSKHLCEHYARR